VGPLNRRSLLAVVVVVLIGTATFVAYEVYFPGSGSSCETIQAGKPARSQTTATNLGAISEYPLPSAYREPNAITHDADGSVWFAEQGLPGVGHLFPQNGTLVEYAWPGYSAPEPPYCTTAVAVSGIAVWNGRVWSADEFGNSIVGVLPSDGSVVAVNTTGKADYPYWLAVGPDGDLWFTSDNLPARLGRILPNFTLQVMNLQGTGEDEPLQLDFVNATTAFLAAINFSEVPSTHLCVCDGRVYSFDPSSASGTITPTIVGPGYHLILPTSVSFADGMALVAQHATSVIVGYNFAAGNWTSYPTSTMPWLDATYPLETDAAGGALWFNEHYANKIALLDPVKGTLIEYSESNPPASNYTQIQNDESIDTSGGGLWFTSLTGSYVGFASGSYDPGFQVVVSGARSASVQRGESTSFNVEVSGTWSSPMGVSVSDSENVTSVPHLILSVPNATQIPAGVSHYELSVKVSVAPAVKVGEYTVAVTLTDGLVQQTVYLFVDVR